MAILKRQLLILAIGLSTLGAAEPLEWDRLKPLPDEFGFAGPFAGVSNGALIVG